MRIIEERDARTEHRKECKRIFDKRFSLAASTPSGDIYRLLDEGLITYADGSPQMYIKKGVIDKMFENMSEDYVGSVNFGHHDLAEDPIAIIGDWRKSDLFVEFSPEDDGRKVLNVCPNLWDDHIYVQQLKRQPYTYGLSAEFYGEIDWEKSEEMGIPVIDSIELLDFAVVGECGNVNSSDIHLRGEDVSKLSDILKKLSLSEATEEEVSEVSEDVSEETEELSVAEEEVSEEEVVEEEKDSYAEVIEAILNEMMVLKASNQKLEEEVQSYRSTMDKLKNLKLSVGTAGEAERVPSEKRYAGKDGIGEL